MVLKEYGTETDTNTSDASVVCTSRDENTGNDRRRFQWHFAEGLKCTSMERQEMQHSGKEREAEDSQSEERS